jgi:hypothetical protein
MTRVDLTRHVGANTRGELAQGGRVERLAGRAVGDPKHGGGVSASAAESGGDRDLLLDLDLQRRRRASSALPEGGECDQRQVRAIDSRALDPVAVERGRIAGDLVGQVDRREERAERMHAVPMWSPDVQDEI